MSDRIQTCKIEDALYCLEQARSMLDQARFMWSQAHQTVKRTQHMRAQLFAQIEELARRGAFGREFASNLLSMILDNAIEATGADSGNIQVLDAAAAQLFITVQRGLREPFLEFFRFVHLGEAACGAAWKTGGRVIVPDVANSPICSDRECLETMLDAGVRAFQSTTLIGKSGRVLGVLSTHYGSPKELSENDLRRIDHFAEWAAAVLEADDRAACPHNGLFSHDGNGRAPKTPATSVP